MSSYKIGDRRGVRMEQSSQPVTDREFLDEFLRSADERVFSRLMERYKSRLFNVAFRVLYDRQAAEDIVQRVFVGLAERKDDLAKVRSLQSWLYATTLNLSLDMLKTMRRRKVREKVAESSTGPESPRDVAMRSELRKELDLALAGLKNSLRIPLILRYLEGLSHEEAGEILGVSSEAVRKRVRRGLRALRTILKARNLVLPVAAIEGALKATPAEAVSANFLASVSSILKTASTAASAGSAAVTATTLLKGGLIMSAKAKIVIGAGAAILLAGTISYIATRNANTGQGRSELEKGDGSRSERPLRQRKQMGPGKLQGALEPEEEASERKEGLWGQVVDVDGQGIPDVTVEAGVFEGDGPTSLVRKVLVRSTTTNANARFCFEDKAVLSRAAQTLKKRSELPQKQPGGLHGLVVATKEGFFPARQQVDFGSLSEPHRIVLKKAPQVRGIVVWKENRKPIAAVNVVCEAEESDLYTVSKGEGWTDKEGRFTLSVMADEAAKVWPELNYVRSKPKEPNVRLVPGEKTEELVFPIELLSETVIMGTVCNAEGEPLVGAEVFLSTENAFAGPTRTREGGHYLLMVSRDYSYRSYSLEDWPENPKRRGDRRGGSAVPVEEQWTRLPDGTRDWREYWIPPANAPPERLVAFHPNYEMGIVDVPALGIGQVRENVDIVLQKGSKVSGKVTDENSVPVRRIRILVRAVPGEGGALVKNDNRFLQSKWGEGLVTSRVDGSYEINFLPEGTYEIAAHHPFWKYEWRRLGLGAHEVVGGFDFVLIRGDGFIKGKVTDEKGNPWPHGKVWAGDQPIRERTEGFSAEIQKDGSYMLTGLEPGKYRLRLEVSEDYLPPDGILWADCLEDVPTGTENANITVKELPAGLLRVRVMNEQRDPVKEFQLECSPLGLPEGRNAIPLGVARLDKGQERTFSRNWDYSGVPHFRKDVASEYGEFVEGRVAPGKYFVSVKSKKHGAKFAEAEVVGGHETEVVFELKSLRRIEGIVRDERGQPLGGVRVDAAKTRELLSTPDRVWIFNDTYGHDYGRESYAPVFRTVECGADGRFVLEDMEQADYRIIATRLDTVIDPHGRYYSALADITVGPTEPTSIELVMRSGTGSVEGCVVGENGTRNYMEVALIGNVQVTRVHTDRTGNYFFEDVLPGQYHVRAQIWGTRWARYEGRDIELKEGEHLRLDIVAEGDGGVQGSIYLAGDAARAADWCRWPADRIIVLRQLGTADMAGNREVRFRVDDTFDLRCVRAGTYEARAYVVLNIKPLGAGNLDFYENLSECRAQFESEPQVISVAAGSVIPVVLTVSRACAPHYPIPNSKSCDDWVIAQ